MGDPSSSLDFSSIIKKHRPDLTEYEKLYREFHQNPEISTQEEETAAAIEKKLKSISSEFDIRTKIGGTGLVAILENGSGKTVLLRADIDALPVEEKTGFEYASTKTMTDNADGKVKPMMHACGHDFHITSALAAAETLVSCKSEWSGTLIMLFQPAEERGSGARAMVDDGLYDPKRHACPVPDILLGQHVMPYRSGTVKVKPGPMALMTASNSYKVTIYGRGGHGSQPHRAIDPVVIACFIVVRLQTIVSRMTPPDEFSVVTVGSIMGGLTQNVIAGEATILVNIRAVTEPTRQKMLKAIRDIVEHECAISSCPKPPLIEQTTSLPLTVNDPEVTQSVSDSFTQYFGEDNFDGQHQAPFGSEDFSDLATAINKPYCYWWFGGIDPKVWDEAEKKGTLFEDIPNNHSPFFGPILQPTLTTGTDALVVGALTFLRKKNK